MLLRRLAFALVLVVPFGATVAQRAATRAPTASSAFLYLWASSVDTTAPDFLAVVDVRDDRPGERYGAFVATLPVPGRAHRTHHTEHTLADDQQLFANGFGSGQSFIFDLRNPLAPRLVRQFGDVGPLMHPHSFWRLPNGNVLATFQMQHVGDAMRPGGLVEMTPSGDVVRTASANLPGVHPAVRPYSAAVLPAVDRVIVTTTDMDRADTTRIVQFWRLSDLTLAAQIELPNGPQGEGYATAEPRLLSDGTTVMVSTFNCGLYLLDGVATATPSARLVASFPRKAGTSCAVPVVAGHYWIVTVPAWSAVVSLDVRDPAHPREVARVTLGPNDVPHWVGLEPNGRRVVVTGYRGMQTRVLLATLDTATGALAWDARFRAPGATEPGLRLEGVRWPHGGEAAAVPHAAVFDRPAVPRSPR